MENQATCRNNRQTSHEFYKKLFKLTGAGGTAFWITNLAISLTPIAAEYRAALKIPYYSMLLESLFGGLIIGFCASYFLLRFFDKIPAKNPILKSVILSFIVLILVTILIGNPLSFLVTGDVLRYFLIGTIFNVIRILALGTGIGYLYQGLYGVAGGQVIGNGISGYSAAERD
jgi:hypothetical protein